MTYRITAEEENEIDQAFNDRDAARANARRLRQALDKTCEQKDRLRSALEVIAQGEEIEAAIVAKQALRNLEK